MNLKMKTPPRELEQIEDRFRFTFVHGTILPRRLRHGIGGTVGLLPLKIRPKYLPSIEKTTIAGTLENKGNF